MNLVINTFGAKLSKENGLFAISTPEGKQTFSPDTVKSISINTSVQLSSDVIMLAIQNGVEVLFVNNVGQPQGRVWSIKYGSISTIRKAQINFLYSTAALPWVKTLLLNKIDRQIALLMGLQPDRESQLAIHNQFKNAFNSMEDYKGKIQAASGSFVSDAAASLRGWEGAATKRYFQCIAAQMPPAFAFSGRDRLPAKDPFNALLNYAYGMLYNKVEGALIKAGLDPYIGIFHRDDYNRPALVFDFIENYRPWVDFVVYQLCLNNAIPQDAFETLAESGAILLTPFAKRVLIQSVNDFLAEIITLEGKPRSRAAHIDGDAQKLVKVFLKEEQA